VVPTRQRWRKSAVSSTVGPCQLGSLRANYRQGTGCHDGRSVWKRTGRFDPSSGSQRDPIAVRGDLAVSGRPQFSSCAKVILRTRWLSSGTTSRAQLLINAVTVHVGTRSNFSGLPTTQELAGGPQPPTCYAHAMQERWNKTFETDVKMEYDEKMDCAVYAYSFDGVRNRMAELLQQNRVSHLGQAS